MDKGVGKVHYILMLDESGSMSGTKWQDLINSVQNFLSTLAGNNEYKTNGRVTCITYNSKAILHFQEKEPDRSLTKKISFKAGST